MIFEKEQRILLTIKLSTESKSHAYPLLLLNSPSPPQPPKATSTTPPSIPQPSFIPSPRLQSQTTLSIELSIVECASIAALSAWSLLAAQFLGHFIDHHCSIPTAENLYI